jgi:hypothetical protein
VVLLGDVGVDVALLADLTALDRAVLTPDPLRGRVQDLAPSSTKSTGRLVSWPRACKSSGSTQTVAFSVAPWRRPRTRFVPSAVIPAATIIVSPAYSTPSIRITGKCTPSNRRSARALTCVAEARTKSRLTLDFSTPKPSGVRSITFA